MRFRLARDIYFREGSPAPVGLNSPIIRGIGVLYKCVANDIILDLGAAFTFSTRR